MQLLTNNLLTPQAIFIAARKTKQGGFTLITLLILSTMASIVVLNSLKDNTIQERLSGNYQKQINARLMAEKGIFTTYNTLADNFSENPDATLLELSEGVTLTGNADNMTDTGYTVTAPSGTLEGIKVGSDGNRNEGKKTLNAVFAKQGSQTSQSSPFANGVVGCDGVSVQGGGTVNSYDSRVSDWNGGAGATNNATVRTLESDGNIKLIGNAIITGHVLSTNSIEFGGSATVTGNVQTNGSIDGLFRTNFGGNITAFKYVNC